VGTYKIIKSRNFSCLTPEIFKMFLFFLEIFMNLKIHIGTQNFPKIDIKNIYDPSENINIGFADYYEHIKTN
jgi:hypothetical protein